MVVELFWYITYITFIFSQQPFHTRTSTTTRDPVLSERLQHRSGDPLPLILQLGPPNLLWISHLIINLQCIFNAVYFISGGLEYLHHQFQEVYKHFQHTNMHIHSYLHVYSIPITQMLCLSSTRRSSIFNCRAWIQPYTILIGA